MGLSFFFKRLFEYLTQHMKTNDYVHMDLYTIYTLLLCLDMLFKYALICITINKVQ